MQTDIHNIFLFVDSLNILGNFLLFVGQNQLGENYLTYSIFGAPEYFRQK